ncbi:sensor histidine kinase [Nonomuraea sp. NPDC049419]|uniref:sensor histidine kinase n=1 Tax=Nonomuraea sp. NPDC049419 TaxID=3155772 RepID=UPI00341EED7B
MSASVAASRMRAHAVRHLWAADCAVAATAGLAGVLGSPTVSFATGTQAVYTVLVIGGCAAMLLRRRMPRLCLGLLVLLLAVHLPLVQLGPYAGVVCLVGAYTTQTRLDRAWRWGYLALFCAVATGGIVTALAATGGAAQPVPLAAAYALLTVAALIGAMRRNAAERYRLAVERADLLEARHETGRRLAVLEERGRIAREMHDILGHSLNAVAVLSEGARHAVRSDPDRTDAALADIGRLSRSAVDEVRDLIDVLRTEDGPAERGPAPSLAELSGLVSGFRFTGTVVRTQVEGDPGGLPGQLGRTAYRIVQEAITNAVKHAPGAAITIRVTITDTGVDLLVTNARPDAPREAGAGEGHGLIGIRERVRAAGGTVEAGPDPATGGWQVHARLPRRRPC